MGKMLTILDVCERLTINRRTVYRWLDTGNLQAVKVGRVWRIDSDELDRFVAALPRSGPKPKDTPNG